MAVEFSVGAIGFLGDGKFYVDGRVADEPLHVGAVFTRIEHRSAHTTAGNSLDLSHRQSPIALTLRVESIAMYGHLVDELDGGLTGRLEFKGLDQADLVRLGWTLCL
jgi:hypothetical protein